MVKISNAIEFDELSLVQAILRKDRKATADFVSAYTDKIYSYVRYRLIPREDMVEDLVQEIFLEAFGALKDFRGDSGLEGWLLGIARHKIGDYYRRRLREPMALDEATENTQPELAVPSQADERLDRERMEAKTAVVLKTLPEAYCVVLLWRYWEKKSAQEMAIETGKSVKAIERTLSRARSEFKRRWSDV
jgi:RNA polymerase sigma-70 factor (ECF subfamily)